MPEWVRQRARISRITFAILFVCFLTFNLHLIVCDFSDEIMFIPRPHLKCKEKNRKKATKQIGFYIAINIVNSLMYTLIYRALRRQRTFRSIEKRFHLCCLVVLNFKNKDAHNVSYIHIFQCAVVLMAGFLFLSIINVMGFHCYCHSLSCRSM